MGCLLSLIFSVYTTNEPQTYYHLS